MYNKGDVKRLLPYCEAVKEDRWEDCECGGAHEIMSYYDENSPITVYLPHSCDEWVIGGREQIKALIEDLQAILDEQ